MEGFTSNFHSFKPSLSFLDIDHNIELLNQISIQNDYSSQTYIGSSSSYDDYLTQQALLPSFDHQFAQNFQHEYKNVMLVQEPVSVDPVLNGKRKLMDVSGSTNSGNSSSHSVCDVNEKKNQSLGKGKKVKLSDNGEAQKEVVHVRARRGQATDSHSLAERVRRKKINERLRCLQDIVPGCCKSMGMAVMLDEIINYVQSLQSQVEFLSLKLTEASRFHDFNSNLTNINTFQMGNIIEGLKMQILEDRKESGPVDQSFGSYPSLPYHRT